MLERLLQIVAPHYCYVCGISGKSLCENCKYNITIESFSGCIICTRPAAQDGICSACNPPYSRAWAVTERRDGTRDLINAFKFERNKAAADTLVELLDEVMPILPADIFVCSVPTIAKHVRQRGYDHAEIIAKRFAKKRGLPFRVVLRRKTNTHQVGANRKQRIENAKQAFEATRVQEGATYLLVDDVFTTGATMEYAARQILNAGAGNVWISVVARQPLDK